MAFSSRAWSRRSSWGRRMEPSIGSCRPIANVFSLSVSGPPAANHSTPGGPQLPPFGRCCYPPGPPFSSSKLPLWRTFDEPGGPQLPPFGRCCYPPGPPFSPLRSSPSGGPSPSQGVRSCLPSVVAATPLDPPFLLFEAPPLADLRRARGSAAASLRSLLLPPWTPLFSSSKLPLWRTFDEPGGPQLPPFGRCCYPPGPPFSPLRSSPSGGPSTSQGVRSCLPSVVAATPLDPPFLLFEAPPLADLRRARGSAAASLRSLLLPPWTPLFSSSKLPLWRTFDEP